MVPKFYKDFCVIQPLYSQFICGHCRKSSRRHVFAKVFFCVCPLFMTTIWFAEAVEIKPADGKVESPFGQANHPSPQPVIRLTTKPFNIRKTTAVHNGSSYVRVCIVMPSLAFLKAQI